MAGLGLYSQVVIADAGAAAGFACAAFILLPVQIEVIAKKRNWLASPVTWREGRAPTGFVLFGALLFQGELQDGLALGLSALLAGSAVAGLVVRTPALGAPDGLRDLADPRPIAEAAAEQVMTAVGVSRTSRPVTALWGLAGATAIVVIIVVIP